MQKLGTLYTYIESDSFEFTFLTPTAKVIVTGSQGDNFFDIARYVNEVSVVGQTFLFSGSSEVDGVMIQPGVKYDLTNLKGSRQASVVFCGESPDLLVDCVDVGDSFSVAIASILLHVCRNVF